MSRSRNTGDRLGREIYEDIKREESLGSGVRSNDPEVDAHNRGVEYRLQRLRDRAEFGENLENVYTLNGTECPWTFGTEPYGTKENGSNDPTMTRKYWRNVDRAGFEECNRVKADDGEAGYNKVYKTAEDDNPKYLMTRHPSMPYCVRCEMPKAVKTDYEDMVKSIEKIANMMSTSRRTKQWEQRAALMDDLERKKEEWNKLYDSIYYGRDVSDFAVPNMGCMDPNATAAMWRNPNDLKNVDPDDIVERMDKDGKMRKVWNRPFAAHDRSSGKLYCARADDPNVQTDLAYHDLQDLELMRTASDKSSTNWPKDDMGKDRSLSDVYNRASFCTQRQSEAACTTGSPQDAPLGERLRPSEACMWNSNYRDGGRCMPADVDDGSTATGTDQGEFGKDKYSQWYKRFLKMEQKLVENPESLSPNFPKQRISVVGGGGAAADEE